MFRYILIVSMLFIWACDDGAGDPVPAGEEGGECLPNDLCNTGLVCLSNLCVSLEPSCGDGAVNQLGEECDNTDFGGETCITKGFTGGALACHSTCLLDLSGCTRENSCGDDLIGDEEACDGADLGGASCNSLGYHGGELACTASCQYDLASCQAFGSCGDGTLQEGYEECDSQELGGMGCADLGFTEGSLACTAQCTFDTAGCSSPAVCGNGVIDEDQGETCDGTLVPTCQELGFWRGSVTCTACVASTDACESGTLYGTSLADYGRDLAFDSAGNLYVTGYTYGALDGQSALGGTDGFLTKFDAQGVKQWTIQVGNGTNDWIAGLTIDFSDNVYLVGRTYGDLNGETAQGGSDIFLAKYDPAGAHQWTRIIGTPGDDSPEDVTLCPCGTILIAGSTTGSFPGFTNAGGTDAILTKYSTAGGRIFLTQWGSDGGTVARTVVVDPSFQIYVAGTFQGTLDGTPSLGGRDIFMKKFTAGAAVVWSHTFGTAADDDVTRIILGPGNDPIVTGSTEGAFPGYTNAGAQDWYLKMFTPDGLLLWTTQGGGAQSDIPSGIAYAHPNIYLSGTTQSALGVHQGGEDIFVTRFDTMGLPGATVQQGTAADDRCMAIALSPWGGLFITGSSMGDYLSILSSGDWDILLGRILL